MSIYRKLNTLLRAGVRESAEQITDANAIRIYRQEVIDAENLLGRRRSGLAAMIATRNDLEKEIAGTQRRIESRETQIAQLAPEQRREELLILAAKDIAANETHLAALKHRHVAVAERVQSEELVLRKLVAEIMEHRREVKILQSQLTSGSTRMTDCNQTIAGHLATLRETRAGISGAIGAIGNVEASMEEAIERVDGDPVNRELAKFGYDEESVHLEAVLSRLKKMETTTPIGE